MVNFSFFEWRQLLRAHHYKRDLLMAWNTQRKTDTPINLELQETCVLIIINEFK